MNVRNLHRPFLLPLFLAVSILFICSGISVPAFSDPLESTLSRHSKEKPGTCIFLKNQVKGAQARIVKAGAAFDLPTCGVTTSRPACGVAASPHVGTAVPPVFDPVFSTRAPPA